VCPHPRVTNTQALNQQVEQIKASSAAAGELWYTDGRHVVDTSLLINTVTFPYSIDYHLAVRAVGRPACEDKQKTGAKSIETAEDL
jgi:hypothetical protein